MIIGLDMGGTHIDAVIIKNQEVIKKVKNLTKKEDIFSSIWETLKELLAGYHQNEIKRINLSTTISTNAIVENKVSRVGMIIQPGPGLNSDFLACGDKNVFISGYTDHRGVIVDDLKQTEIKAANHLFKTNQIETVAVVSKFSTRNPDQELNIGNSIDKDFKPITYGHKMSGKLNFPRRVFTSYLNSAVTNTFNSFSLNIKKSLAKEGIKTDVYILKADGGTMTIESAELKPVETILSGPAASFMGMSAMMKDENLDAVLLDIGGTTTDIFFLSNGTPLFEPLGAKISKYNTLVRAIYSVSIGLGGDSAIKIEQKDIKIGPKREGNPYALGGPSPTPTDAMIYLELMALPKGASKEKAKKAIEILSKQLNKTKKDTAELILNKMAELIKEKVDELLLEINSKPIYTVKELLHGKKVEPKKIFVIGGPARILANVLKDNFNLPCDFPANYEVANAIGAALAKPTFEITMLANTSLGKLSVPELTVFENIPRTYTLEQAKTKAIELLKAYAVKTGLDDPDQEIEITEENSFNMVRGFLTSGKNIRIKAQIKPGYIQKLGGNPFESQK